MLSRKYITGAAAQPSEPPTPWMLKARPSRPWFTDAFRSAKSAGWKTQLPRPPITAMAAKPTKECATDIRASATADDRKPAGQDRPGAEAVDREARRRLGDARHAVEDARQQADIGRS